MIKGNYQTEKDRSFRQFGKLCKCALRPVGGANASLGFGVESYKYRNHEPGGGMYRSCDKRCNICHFVVSKVKWNFVLSEISVVVFFWWNSTFISSPTEIQKLQPAAFTRTQWLCKTCGWRHQVKHAASWHPSKYIVCQTSITGVSTSLLLLLLLSEVISEACGAVSPHADRARVGSYTRNVSSSRSDLQWRQLGTFEFSCGWRTAVVTVSPCAKRHK